MANYYTEKTESMIKLTEDFVRELVAVWLRTFDDVTCRANMQRLQEHATNFYNDLVSESLEKKSYIENEIEELRNEAENLRRLLNTEVQLLEINESDETPLVIIQNEMDKSLRDLREQLRQRRDQICDLILEQETLCEELGEPPRPLLDDPLPTAEEIQEFRSYLDALKEERLERTHKLMSIRRTIKNDLQILEINVNTETDDRLLNHRQIKLNTETFDQLEKLRERFAKQVLELKTSIDNMRHQLPSLWNRLNTPYEERRRIDKYTEYNQVTHDILSEELQRCEDIKRQNIKHYIQKIRHEIELWWDKTLKSDAQRSRFANFNNNMYTDELLTLHEMELEDLQNFYETNKQILTLYADRKVLWDRMEALEKKASEPGRYNNRGGQLLREEKERKTIATKLPKIEQQIQELAAQYMEREHEHFLVNGKDILKVMESEWEAKRLNKEAMSTARKNATTPQTGSATGNIVNRTQMSSASRTPLVPRSATSAMFSRTPSRNNVSTSKRTQIIGTSAQKRKLNPSEKTTPVAKRSLFNNSQGVFRKPAAGRIAQANEQQQQQARKRGPRVLATTIRRKSGRLSSSGAIKKRRSLSKSIRNATGVSNEIPEILITDVENYDCFEKCISPDSRSSIVCDSFHQLKFSSKNKLKSIEETNTKRLVTLPKPQNTRTPSKQNLRDYPVSPASGSSSTMCGKKKLTTKNLPILI